MKKLLPFLLAFWLSLPIAAQQTKPVSIGSYDSIQSRILGEQRNLWVYVPAGWQPGSKQRYPVVYLLDGDGHFYSVVGMIQQLSQVNGNTICPEMIVVGIHNTDRTRDLTPTHVEADPPFMDSAFSKTSGGGEKFTHFIQDELMPYIDSAYPTQPYRMLIGHSFGGLTVMNMLMNHTKLFNAYISIDPSMWWDQLRFLKGIQQQLAEKKFSRTSLYLGIANTMEEGMDIQKVQKDTNSSTKHIRAILALDQELKNRNTNGLQYASKYYDSDDHGSVPLIATYDALRFFFEKYRFKFSYKEYLDISFDLAKKFREHYRQVSELMGYSILPPENMINGLGYDLLQQKQYNKAGGLFQMNVENYPGNYNVYDSYADYFNAIGDKAKAIEYFQKALSIQEWPDTRKKLNELLGKE